MREEHMAIADERCNRNEYRQRANARDKIGARNHMTHAMHMMHIGDRRGSGEGCMGKCDSAQATAMHGRGQRRTTI